MVRRRIQTDVLGATRAKLAAGAAASQRAAVDKSWFVLVVDQYALRVVSSAMRHSDLVNEGVALVDRLELEREKFPRMHAAFLMNPCHESFDALLREEPDTYAGFHLFFLSRVPDDVMERFAVDLRTMDTQQRPGETKRQRRKRLEEARRVAALREHILTFVEVNVDFMAPDERLFTLDRPCGALYRVYQGDRADMGVIMDEIDLQVEQLVTVCSTLGVKPDVRYSVRAPLARGVAEELCKALEVNPATRALPSNAELGHGGAAAAAPTPIAARTALPSRGSATRAAADDAPALSPDAMPTTLVVLDRSFDPLAPLLHEFTYQAMVMDVLEASLNRTKAGGVRTQHEFVDNSGAHRAKDVIIDDVAEDAVFTRIRFLHMAEAIPELTEAFKTFLDSNHAAKLQMRSASGASDERSIVDLKDLGAAIRALPQYREQLTKYSLHTHLASQCMRAFRERDLEALAGVEQDLACGRDAEGRKVRREALVEALNNVFARGDRYTEDERTRVLLLALFAKATSSCAAASALDQHVIMQRAVVGAGNDRPQHVLEGVRALMRCRPPKTAEQLNWWQRRQRKRQERRQRKARLAEEVPYDLSRFRCAVRSTLEEFVRGAWNADEWPRASVGGNAAQGASSSAAAAAAAASSSSFSSGAAAAPLECTQRPQRIVLFILGGVTCAELRAAHKVADKSGVEIILGGSGVLTPSDFVRGVRAVSDHALAAEIDATPIDPELQRLLAEAERAREPSVGVSNEVLDVLGFDTSRGKSGRYTAKDGGGGGGGGGGDGGGGGLFGCFAGCFGTRRAAAGGGGGAAAERR